MERYKKRSVRNNNSRKDEYDQRASERYDAVCDSCGRDCQVPFKPIKGKPVFCVNCYKKDNDQESLRFSGKKNDSSRMEKFKATCDKCGEECEVPFKPNGKKPVLCSRCYSENQKDFDFDDIPQKDNDQTENKLNMINSKLDEILKMLNIVSTTNTDFEDRIIKSKKKLRKVNNFKLVKKSKKKEKRSKSKTD